MYTKYFTMKLDARTEAGAQVILYSSLFRRSCINVPNGRLAL